MVLPKAYGVIERFSENIDLVLDWSNLTKNPTALRSKNQQQKLNVQINTAAKTALANRDWSAALHSAPAALHI